MRLLAACAALFTAASLHLTAQDAAKPVVVIDTNKGVIEVELNAEKAPITVKNFLAYVDAKHFDGTIFHRVIPGFMIQGGGFTADMQQKATQPPIKNESGNGLSNVLGSIAMARTQAMDSATCQFFINVADNSKGQRIDLDSGKYCVFGQVTSGMDVVKAIEKVATGNRGMHQNVPTEAVVIKSITRKAAAAAPAPAN
jgi:peptidyl-prolyl cis-trans isomerase A (cyclophilin A)